MSSQAEAIDVASELLPVCAPSEILRRDEALAQRAAVGEIAHAKEALASIAIADKPEAPPSSVRERLLASMRRPGRYGAYVDRMARMFDISTAEAEALMARIDDPAAWNPFFVPGVEVLEVKTGPRLANAVAVIARLQPGARFPEHAHSGEETMFVLAGGFREEGEGGHEIWRGDELLSGSGTGHAFVALPGEPCIAASLIEGFAEFR